MAISLDASTPALVTTPLNNTSLTLATASFSPPAGSLVVIAVTIGYDTSPGGAGPTVTVADSGSVSYTAGPKIFDTAAEGTYFFQHYYTTAPGSITVTATRTTETSEGAMYNIKTYVLDGASPIQTGAATATNDNTAGTGTALTQAITPTVVGSWVMASVTTSGGSTALTISGITQDNINNDASDGETCAFGHAVTSATTSETIGWTTGSGVFFALALWEILPASSGAAPMLPQNQNYRKTQRYHGNRRRQPMQILHAQILTVNAGLATGTGAAQGEDNSSFGWGETPGLTSGTGAAQAVGGGLTTGLSTGTGAAQFAGPALTPALATGTSAAQAPGSGLTIGLASGTGTAQAPGLGLTIGLATGAGTALGEDNSSFGYGLTPALATGTGTAQTPENGLGGNAGLASGTGAANAPNLGLTPGLSSGTGAAQAVGGGLTTGLSTGTGTAQFAGPALTPGIASGTGTAQVPGSGFTSGLASGTGTAQAPGSGLTPGLATGTGAALTPLANQAGQPAAPMQQVKSYTLMRSRRALGRQQPMQAFQTQSYTVTAGLATSTGAAQAPGTGLTPGLATGTGTSQPPTYQSTRVPLNLGGSATPEFPYNGTLTELNYGGSVSYGNLLGGSVTPVNTLGGSVTPVEPYGGTATVPSSTLGGTVGYGNTLGGSLIGWTMQQVNLTLAENNDESVNFAVTSNSSALDISTATINVYFKTAAGTTDGAALMFSSGGGSPAITITNGPGGLCTLAIPHSDLYPETYTFYRLDVVFSGLQNTAIYGNITWITL